MRRRAQAQGVSPVVLLVPERLRPGLGIALNSGPHSSCTSLVRPAPALAPCAVFPGEVHGHTVLAWSHLWRGRCGAQRPLPRLLLGLRLRLRCPHCFRSLARPCSHSGPEVLHALPGSGGPPLGHGADIVPFITGIGVGLSRPTVARRKPRPVPQTVGLARPTKKTSRVSISGMAMACAPRRLPMPRSQIP